jgi:hypothetical protein
MFISKITSPLAHLGTKCVVAAAALAWGAFSAPACADVLPEIQVTSSKIIDNEYDWGRDGVDCPISNYGDGNNRFVFTDRDYNMWLGHVDPLTGDFDPPDGHGELIDTNAAFATEFGNGPEWMFGTEGSQIVYTKYFPGRKPSTFSASVAIAEMIDDASWKAGIIQYGIKKQSPIATLDLDDPAPRINYQDFAKKNVYWRIAEYPNSEQLMPISDQTGGGSRRWVPGTHKVIFSGSAPPDENGIAYQQVFLYDTDTDELKQLTFDPVTKWGAFMWQAPEYNNEYVFFTVYGRTSIAIYRYLPGSRGVRQWTIDYQVPMPENLPYAWSPEPFVHNGHSFIFFQISSSPAANDLSVPTQIAMTGIDAAHPFRMLTNDASVRRVRMDPEYYILPGMGPFIYYNRYIPSTPTREVINDGVWRVDTKLGPPDPAYQTIACP